MFFIEPKYWPQRNDQPEPTPARRRWAEWMLWGLVAALIVMAVLAK